MFCLLSPSHEVRGQLPEVELNGITVYYTTAKRTGMDGGSLRLAINPCSDRHKRENVPSSIILM